MNEFWWGVIVTGTIGIPLSILANLTTPRIAQYLEAGSGRLKQRNKRFAIAAYCRRKRLLDDPIHREMYFVRIQLHAIIGVVLTSGIILGLLILKPDNLDTAPLTIQINVVGATLLAAALGALALGLVSQLASDATALGDFARYEKQVVERFGADAIKPQSNSVFD